MERPAHKYIFVYQTINQINGKSYVGVHATNDIDDGYIGCGISRQSGASKNLSFHRAVKKYGYASFKRYILSFFDTYNDALAEEKHIVNLAWVKSNNNYNAALGGFGGAILGMADDDKRKMYEKAAAKRRGKKRSKEVCAKMSASKRGVKLSESHKQSLRNSNAKYWLGKPISDYMKERVSLSKKGIKLSSEHRAKLSKAHIGLPSNRIRPILRYSILGDFMKEYSSVTAAAKELGLGRTAIANNLSNRIKTSGGYVFKYKEVVVGHK